MGADQPRPLNVAHKRCHKRHLKAEGCCPRLMRPPLTSPLGAGPPPLRAVSARASRLILPAASGRSPRLWFRDENIEAQTVGKHLAQAARGFRAAQLRWRPGPAASTWQATSQVSQLPTRTTQQVHTAWNAAAFRRLVLALHL